MCVCTCACVCVKNKEHACARAYSSRISITQYIHPCHKNRSTQCTSSGRHISVLYSLCGSDILVRLWDQSCVREVARVHACVHACALTYAFLRVLCAWTWHLCASARRCLRVAMHVVAGMDKRVCESARWHVSVYVFVYICVLAGVKLGFWGMTWRSPRGWGILVDRVDRVEECM